MKRNVSLLLIVWLSLLIYKVEASAAFAAALYNIRLNKVFTETHSRRSADALIAAGRVKVNGETVHDMGRRVIPFRDCVELDGRSYTGWESRHHGVTAVMRHEDSDQNANDTISHYNFEMMGEVQEEYIKYWKPVGVTSTTDRSVSGNLIDTMDGCRKENDRITQRIFSVGRLDKDSSGLLLLTSDGRLPNAVLRKEFKRPKVYHVTVDKPVLPQHVAQLRAGLIITTDTVRQGKHRPLTALTLPCQVILQNDYTLQMTLTEGRNRQIRVMLQTVGDYTVSHLHRTEFMGIDLSRLSGPGDWTRLNETELQVLNQAMMLAYCCNGN